jgi:hypothetical protein
MTLIEHCSIMSIIMPPVFQPEAWLLSLKKMKRQRPPFSIIALIIANLAPLFGVLFLSWDAATIVLLYWVENLIIGGYNIVMMILVKVKSRSAQFQKLFMIPFFTIHYGGFCAAHGFFLLTFFKIGSDMDGFSPQDPWPGPLVFVQLLVSVITRLWESRPAGFEWPVIGLVVSHGISFIRNYLIGGEYLTRPIGKLMSRPYKRIVLMHVAIIAGGVPIMMLGSPVPLLCILIILKIAMDIWLHTKSHKADPLKKRGKHRDRKVEGAAKKNSDIRSEDLKS